MNKKILIAACLCSIAFSACENNDNVSSETKLNTPEVNEDLYQKGVVRVKISELLSEKSTQRNQVDETILLNAISQELDNINITSIKRLYPYAGKFEARTREMGMHLWYVVRYDNDVPATRVESNFKKGESLIAIEKIPVIKHYKSDFISEVNTPSKTSISKEEISNEDMPFNDPLLVDQWHYRNDGSVQNSIIGADVNVFPVWNKGHVGNPDVIVCIVDEGVDHNHEDLIDNRHINYTELNGTPGVDDDGNGYIDDVYGYNFVKGQCQITPGNHGSHVAGIIAAANNNNLGICGIAGGNGNPNTGVKYISAQIFEGNNGSDGAPAIKYGADNGAVISQNSWGYPMLTSIPESDKLAIDYFIKYAGVDENGNQTGPIKGGIVVFAAGNENRVLSIPGMHEDAVAVTSIAPDYTKAYYSNYGEWADIIAPGGSLQTTFGSNEDGGILSTIANNKYGRMQGTSMACPHVSGGFALLVSQIANNGEMGVTGKEVVSRMLNRTRDISNYDPYYKPYLGRGLMDLVRALGEASTIAPDPVTDLHSLNILHNNITLEWTVPNDEDNGNFLNFTIYYSESTLSGIDYNNLPENVSSLIVTEHAPAVGESMSMLIKNLKPSTNYYFTIIANDFSDNKSEVSNEISVRTNDNQAPIFESMEGFELNCLNGVMGRLKIKLTDPDNDAVTVNITNNDKNAVTTILSQDILIVFVNTSITGVGVFNYEVMATDSYGATNKVNVKCIVKDNLPPTQTKDFSNYTIEGLNKTLRLNWREHFAENDGQILKANAVINNKNIKAKIEGDNVIFTSESFGESEVAIVVTNEHESTLTSNKFTIKSIDPTPDSENVVVSLYPNPVIDKLNVKLDRKTNAKVNIYNISGANVYNNDAVGLEKDKSYVIDMSKQKTGQYSVVIEANGQKITRKITKL